VILGVIYIIILVIQLIYFWIVRRRIPFAQATIAASVQAVQDHSGPVYVTFVMVFLSIGWIAFWSFVFVAILHVSTGNGQSNNLNGLAYFLLLISLYWTLEVLRNIGHTTTAGVVATWWFNPSATTATWPSFVRATTTSLGSICLGSLIVAILQAVRQIVREAAKSRDCGFLACILLCLLDWIESLVRYFNMYAYTRVAIYGTDYITSAKETWQMFVSRGFEVIVNDDLTGMVLAMGSIIGGVVTGVICGVWAHAELASMAWVYIGIVGFVIGYIMVFLIMTVIQSAVATTYVVWSEDPATITQTRPAHYQKLRDAANIAYGVSL